MVLYWVLELGIFVVLAKWLAGRNVSPVVSAVSFCINRDGVCYFKPVITLLYLKLLPNYQNTALPQSNLSVTESQLSKFLLLPKNV